MTVTVPQVTNDPVYGSTVADPDKLLARALEKRRARQELDKQAQRALDAEYDAVRAYYDAARGTASDNELARRLGMNPSTFRSVINRAPRAR